MKSLTMGPKAAVAGLAVLAALGGCKTGGGDRMAAHDTTVEYYRVFDLRTDAAPPAVAKAASAGITRNLKDAVIAMPDGVQVTEVPGHVRMVDPAGAHTGAPAVTAAEAAAASGPTCEGAAWTAKATPRVRGGDNMNIIACLFPYKSGYHLDMYAVFTKPEGGWLYWPRRLGGALLGTPERFTENTMLDVVRAIRETTGAQVALVEAKPALQGTPWLEPGTNGPAVTQHSSDPASGGVGNAPSP
jgi:hypothetical protein